MYHSSIALNNSSWFSDAAKSLSLQLIHSLQIQQGSQLAKMLSVDPIFYNSEAVYVWVQRKLDEGIIDDQDDYALSILETAFIDLVDDNQDDYALSTTETTFINLGDDDKAA